jgi:hypothetical protein
MALLQAAPWLSSALTATLGLAAVQTGPLDRRLEDPALAPLADGLARLREARATGQGVEAAREGLEASLEALRGELAGVDPLSSPADIGRAVWLSWRRDDARQQRGSVVSEVHQGGSFAADGMAYAYRLPKEYDPDVSYPLILSIPDEGERPADHLREHWVHRQLLDQAILFSPAMPALREEWDQVVVAGRPGGLAHVLTAYRLASERLAVDPDRVYVVGRGKGVPAAVAAGNYSPHRFAGIAGRAGDAGEIGPDNFSNLPTFFAGGGSLARAFQAKVQEAGRGNCRVEPDADEEDVWQWMLEHPRAAYPASVEIAVGTPFPTRVYWLRVAPTAMDTRAKASIDRSTNTIAITCHGTSHVALFLNDALVDLERPVKFVVNGAESSALVGRSLPSMLGLLEEGQSDAGALYTAQHVCELPTPPGAAAPAVVAETPAEGPTGELTPAEKKRLASGWVRQDLEWVAPEDAQWVRAGLWRVDGEWIDLTSANRRHAEIHSMWHIPVGELVVHATADRAVALRAAAEMRRALGDLRLVFGAEPAYPLPVAVLRDEEQYDRMAFGDPDGRRPPTHVGRLHVIHSAYFAESWFEPVEGDYAFRGMGVCYWDAFAPNGDLYGVHSARLAVGLSYAEALDPSPKAVRSAEEDGPGLDYYASYQSEKELPAWLRYGGAVYAERFFRDTTVGLEGDPWWTRKWSVDNLRERGGLRPLGEIFAFPIDPDDRIGSSKLLIECGLLAAFLVDGGCAPVSEEHANLKRALVNGRLHPNGIEALEQVLVAHEAELRAFAGL